MSVLRRLGMANFGIVVGSGSGITVTNQVIIAEEIEGSYNGTTNTSDPAPATATTSYTLGSNGNVVIQSTSGNLLNTDGGSRTTNYNTLLSSEEWIANKANAGNYSVKWVLNAGSFPSPSTTPGAQNTWLALTTNRVWTLATGLSSSVPRNYGATFTISIALTSDTSTILDTAQITLSSIAEGYSGGLA